MKYNFSENQYIQLAKEQFCNTMKVIPFVSDIEILNIVSQQEFGDFWALVHFSDTNQVQKFCIEVKSNGEKRFVNEFMMMTSQNNDDACYVFMAPYISESSSLLFSLLLSSPSSSSLSFMSGTVVILK